MDAEKENLHAYAWSDETKPVRQHSAYSCASASLSYAYSLLGLSISEREIKKDVNVDREGGGWVDIAENILNNNFDLAFFRNKTYDDLLQAQILYSSPIIIQWFSTREPDYHGFHVSVIREMNEMEITLMDPAFCDFFSMSRDNFEKCWFDENREKNFLIVHPSLTDIHTENQTYLPPVIRDWKRKSSSAPTHAVSLACAYESLGNPAGELLIKEEMGLLEGEECWIDIIENALTHGFGAAIHGNLTYERLMRVQLAYHFPTLIILNFDHNGTHDESLTVISGVENNAITLKNPFTGENITMPRKKLETKWKQADHERTCITIIP